jgi:uncharacterized repeat protein (TIGR03803 family)
MKNFMPHPMLTVFSALILFVVSPVLYAQVYTQVHNFDWHKEGANPNYPALLAQGQDGNLYSTLQSQLFADGSIFLSTLTGAVTDLHDFEGLDGSTPQSGLSLGFDGNFYGVTETGGSSKVGTIFSYGAGGFRSLYSFTDGSDGAYPWATPIQAPDGNLYGITDAGSNPGEIYRLNPVTGAFSIIATAPYETVAPLILGADGNLYGTTSKGGTSNEGTVFQLTITGKKPKLKIIHSFATDGIDGINPNGPVVQGLDGKLYGTTVWGGTIGVGTVFAMTTSGGGYKILHNFQGTDGTNLYSGVVEGSDKFLYGVTARGGVNGVGTLFKVSTTGTGFADLHDFDTTTGDTPFSTPMLHTNGTIYGTTNHGGTPNTGYGVLYSFTNGLKPFASIVVIGSGKVGTQVGIIGQGFSSATGVKFGTGAGTFTVVSDTYMIASPAQGSTTGTVTVLEPGGNLVTPQTFKVVPSITGFTPPSGPVGTSVTINGMSLTQTTSVTFGGVKATSFTVNSDIQVTATVPTGAKTGTIKITTKGGSATSSTKFTVN